MSNENEWLKNLKAGDKVIRRGLSANIGFDGEIRVITKATPAVVSVGDMRFSRKDGSHIGAERFYRYTIAEATAENMKPIKHRELFCEVRHKFTGSHNEFTYDQLKRIAAIINEPQGDGNETKE